MRSKAQGLTPFIPLFVSVIFLAIWAPVAVLSAPYAAMVIDARSGEVLHSRNADTRLHPASLTKMMTLYIAFEAIERGEISLDQKVLVSQKAAAEPPSKLGLKAGQRIALRYLIRAAAVKSANDAATAIAEAIEGSEAAFARRMNRTANALGMTRTTFKNAHGLTESGHLSTARDMTTMGRRLFYDYPQYYNIFSRQTTDAGIRDVANTNRRLLASYKGADGIKTGYTNAAGFNLVASAERGNERVIATVFGGRSTATRNARVAELLDLGFKRAPSRVAVRKPPAPLYPSTSGAEKSVRTVLAIAQSPRPRARPGPVAPPGVLTAAVQETVSETLGPNRTRHKTGPTPCESGDRPGGCHRNCAPSPRAAGTGPNPPACTPRLHHRGGRGRGGGTDDPRNRHSGRTGRGGLGRGRHPDVHLGRTPLGHLGRQFLVPASGRADLAANRAPGTGYAR